MEIKAETKQKDFEDPHQAEVHKECLMAVEWNESPPQVTLRWQDVAANIIFG